GRRFLAPAGFGAPELIAATISSPAAVGAPPTATPGPPPWASAAAVTARPSSSAPQPSPPPSATPVPDRSTLVPVEPPDSLPSFGAVGGMVALKKELQDTLGLVLAYPDKADAFRITWNGILLHAPPGVGKTFIAKATCGEFGLNFLPVP